jgi:hypothetical protein
VHNEQVELFRVGSTVGPGVKKFVETGDTEIIEQERIKERTICYFEN